MKAQSYVQVFKITASPFTTAQEKNASFSIDYIYEFLICA